MISILNYCSYGSDSFIQQEYEIVRVSNLHEFDLEFQIKNLEICRNDQRSREFQEIDEKF